MRSQYHQLNFNLSIFPNNGALHFVNIPYKIGDRTDDFDEMIVKLKEKD